MNIIWHKRCATHWKQKIKFLSTPFSMPLHMRKDNKALQKLFALFFFFPSVEIPQSIWYYKPTALPLALLSSLLP